MTTEQIVENNKLIAEFMSLKQVNWNGEGMVWVNKDFKEDFTYVDDYSNNSKFDWANSLPNADNLLYHTSWDWLMPVVEKIENDGVQTFDDMNITVYSRFEIRHNHVKLHWSKCHGYQLFLEVIPKWMSDSSSCLSKEQIRVSIEKETSKIEAVYYAVVEFIKWHNQNNK